MLPPQPAAGKLRLVVVGEAPCSADLQSDGVFRSSGGRVLDHALQSHGLARRNVHLTNAILCDCRLKDRKKAAKHCMPRLQQELTQLPAEVPAVVFDGIATRATLQWPKATQIQQWRGTVAVLQFTDPTDHSSGTEKVAGGESLQDLGSEVGSPDSVSPKERDTAARTLSGPACRRLVLPMVAPFEVLRTPRWRPVWEGDWERVERILEGGWCAPEDAPGRRLVIAKDLDMLHDAMAQLAPGDVAADVETVGLGPTETALVCTGYSDGKLTIVVPWSRGRDGAEPWWPAPRQALEIINRAVCARRMITHNGPGFDHIVYRRYGFKWNAWGDTLLATHALASHMPKTLAHVVTTSGIDVGPWKQLESRTSTLEKLWSYNGVDSLVTILAWQHLRSRVLS